MSREVARRGGKAESFEILRSPLDDLRRGQQKRSLFARIRAGEVSAVWVGITCASWSRARRAPPESKMPSAIRDDDKYILGLPNLNAKDQAKVDDGNSSLDFLCALIKICLKHNVMIVVENPATSRLWIAFFARIALEPTASLDNIDYCSFGMAWRKRTRLVSWVRPLRNLPKLCLSKGGVCSYSGHYHDLLTGVKKGGFKTAAASPYPAKMCKLIAPQLIE